MYIHIKYYRQPWDAKDENLVSLCKRCHMMEEELIKASGIIKDISKKTCIPAIVLVGILDELGSLKRNDVEEFKDYIHAFFKNKITAIKRKAALKWHGREVTEAGMGGRLKYVDSGEYV